MLTSKISYPSRADLVASLGVFIIAVPLSLGIALASGAPAGAGLIAAVIGGIVVGLLAGAPLVVSGPAAGLTALVFQYVMTHGIVGLAIITVLAGFLQIALGAARVGKVFNVVPAPMLSGMLAAIGLMIAAGQLHVLVGAKVPSGFLSGIASIPSVLTSSLSTIDGWTIAGLGLLAIAIQVLWPKLGRKAQFIPGALPAVVIVSLLAIPLSMPRVEIASLFTTSVDAINAMVAYPWNSGFGALFIAAVGLALVASAETLLTARAVQDLALGKGLKSKLDLNRELLAQGTGNILSGALGGLPMTGVIVRSAANVNFGAKTRWSAVLHGAWILLFVAALPTVLAGIPLTALAAVLVLTGFKLLNVQGFLATCRKNAADGAIWASTLLLIISTDLLTGLAWSALVTIVIKWQDVSNWLALLYKPKNIPKQKNSEFDTFLHNRTIRQQQKDADDREMAKGTTVK